MAPTLTLHRAAFGYRGRPILTRLNLSFAKTDFVLISGANGSGKSTLLRGLSGLIPPLSGRVDCGRARLGLVPQQATIDLPLSLTVREVVEFGSAAALPWWRSLTSSGTATMPLLAACRADHLAKHAFHSLSGGQRQRVLLARALATKPDFLLLDEPLTGVDIATRRELVELLAHCHADGPCGIILVSHEPAPFRPLVTRELEVRDGAIHATTATPHTISNSPS